MVRDSSFKILKTICQDIKDYLPICLQHKKFTYVEPFVGSDAVLFWMLAYFPNLEKAVINDVNDDLINCYRVIAAHPDLLIALLEDWQSEFHAVENYEIRKKNIITKNASFIMRKARIKLSNLLYLFF